MNEFISPSPSLGSQTMSDQGQASLPSDNAPFYSVPSPPMIAWDAFRDARRAALEQEVAALASVGGVGVGYQANILSDERRRRCWCIDAVKALCGSRCAECAQVAC